MRLQEIMNTDVVTIGPDEPANTAWSQMERKRIRHLVVMEDGRLVGVLSERDLGGRSGASVRRNRTVRELMTPQVASAKPTTTLRQAANLMRGRLIGSLPVLEDGRVVGIVTATDVLEELGRGSTRPTVRAARKSMRVPPVGARRAAAKRASTAKRRSAGKRGHRTAKRAKRGGRRGDDSIGRGSGAAALARERQRQYDSPKRAPMAARIERSTKMTAERASSAEVPAYIRSAGAMLEAADKAYLRRKLGRKLGKFTRSIERTSVRVEDVNGPRGGTDKRCAIKVVLRGAPTVYVEERHHSLQAAMDRALARTERAVAESVQRRRTKPRKSRRTEERIAGWV